MRQYFIFYKRGKSEFKRLNPQDYRSLIDKAEINLAVDFMRDNPVIEGVCVRLDDELFNITSTNRPDLLPDAFLFDMGTPADE